MSARRSRPQTFNHNAEFPISWDDPLAVGLVRYWPLGKDDGLGFGEATGRGFDAVPTITGTPAWTGSPHGTALDLDGSTRFSTPYTNPVTTNTITVSCWFKPSILTRGDLVSCWLGGGDAGSQFLLTYGLDTGFPDFFLSTGVVLEVGEAGSGLFTGMAPMEVGNWYHVCGVYDGVRGTTYLNGILYDSTPLNLTLNTTSLSDIVIGDNGDSDGPFTGAIEKVGIWNRALSDSEVGQLYSEPWRPIFSAARRIVASETTVLTASVTEAATAATTATQTDVAVRTTTEIAAASAFVSATLVVIGAANASVIEASNAATAATVTLVAADVVGFSRAVDLTVLLDAKTRAIYTALAADTYRTSVLEVPGTGPVLGVLSMAFGGIDRVFAFRATDGNTEVLIYGDSPTGWALVPLHNLVSFTAGGTAVPLDGDILTQGGVTATIQRVVWQSGAWAGSAVGQFVVTEPVGGSFAAGAAHTTSGATLTLAGIQTAITLAAGGRFEFVKCNFSGQLITRRAYGCDGVNPAFEFDGVTLTPIMTGLSPNRPNHIWFHKNLLFLSQDASLLFSAAGDPFKWSALDGAGEIATGDTVTGMITLPGSQTTATLAVYLRTNTAFLYGTDPTTFNFVTFNDGVGAAPYSLQNFFDTFFLDNLGVVTLKTTLNYGNFLPSTLTKNLLPFIQRERGNLVASSVKREKSQYRLFFSDGYGLYCTIHNQQYMGALPVLFPDPLTCVDTTNLVSDEEATYAGAQSGFVYQLDKGTSFDGGDISAYMVTAWDSMKSPRILKRFRAASIEVQGDSYAEFNYGYQLGYNSDQLAQLPGVDLPLNFASVPLWDSFTWDAFVWDGFGLSPTDIDETGTAENVRVTITSGTNYIASYTVDSIIHHYSMRRGMRV